MIFAYMRISTNKESQKTDRQRLTLETYARENNFTIDQFFEERITGKTKAENRPEYNKLRDKVRAGDTIIISDLDRLGRNADDVIAEVKRLKADGIRVVALDIPYLNEWNKVNEDSMYSMIIDIVITLKAHMAQQEREKTVTRINAGLNVARAKGVTLGRPKATLPKDFIKEYQAFKNGEYGKKMTATKLAKQLGLARSTYYKYVDIYEKEEAGKILEKNQITIDDCI